MKRAFFCSGLIAATVLLFLLAPQIDLSVSGWFYQPHHGFVLHDWAPVAFIYHVVPWITWAAILILALAGAWLFLMERPLWRFDRKALLFVALSVALGPGLLANTLLKDHWGRARPTQIEAFGGSRHFHASAVARGGVPAKLLFCFGSCCTRFLARRVRPLVAGRDGAVARDHGCAWVWRRGRARAGRPGRPFFVGCSVGRAAGIRHDRHFTLVDRREGCIGCSFGCPCYRLAGCSITSAWSRASGSKAAKFVTAGVATAILVMISMALVDRPVALYLHAQSPDLRALFALIGRLGEAWGWLVLFALAFVSLHWGGELRRLRALASAMRANSRDTSLFVRGDCGCGVGG